MNRVVVAAAALLSAAAAAWAQPGVEAQDPTALAQFQSNGTTTLASGGVLWNTSAVLKAVMHGLGAGGPTFNWKIRAEVRPLGTPFTNVFTDEGTPTPNNSFETNGGDAVGATSAVTITGLVPGQVYHWQAMTWKS
jgi:hypothetical protein